MIVKILIWLVSVVALFLVYAAFRPAHFHVQRTATLDASPAVLFAQVNDHHQVLGVESVSEARSQCEEHL